ncbi:aminopeptidase P family protein [bacterium]|jgi:Xaa-Pro aminopeptidase|nr:aminopeptidase P family protein [bacterium]MBT3794937.1 aminopeptidase P family protein [bacterium]MBT4634673.1 aminopeptidase P family protein [bacterium]
MKVMNLIYDDTKNSSDLLYKARFKAPDPIIFFEIRKKKYLVLNDLEIQRGKKQAKVDEVLSLREISQKIKSSEIVDIIKALIKKFNITKVVVPYSFPSYVFNEIKKSKIKIEAFSSPIFFKSRLIKDSDEINKIKKTMKLTELVLGKIIDKIKSSKARNSFLYLDNKILTSQILRSFCQKELVSLGLECPDCIISSGRSSALPHHEGSGPIKESSPIILDIFPRHIESGYFADITRTVIKGKPSDILRDMFKTVLQGQRIGVKLVKAGRNSKTIHSSIKNFFDKSGFLTDFAKNNPEGFIHSTGHGLGLDIHEPPRVSLLSETLKRNHVITIEPGLYYPKIGGIRIEDTVVVTDEGCRNLSSFPKMFEI